MKLKMLTAFLLGVIMVAGGCDSAGEKATQTGAEADTIRVSSIPVRAAGAVSGAEFLSRTNGSGLDQRQTAAVCEMIAGNIPENLRTLAPIRFGSGNGDSLTVWVTRDYLSIGSDGDDVRMPLSMPSARVLADSFNMLLPTTRIVDAIYEQADLRLVPQPMTPGPEMRSNDYYRRHHGMIEEQRAGRAPDGLIAGHKKDVVVSTKLYAQTDRVAIYGWHRGVGDPIQPLYFGHVDHYEDYSHGLRLVWPEAELDGRMVPLQELLGDPAWRPVLSDEPSLLIESLSRPDSEHESDCP